MFNGKKARTHKKMAIREDALEIHLHVITNSVKIYFKCSNEYSAIIYSANAVQYTVEKKCNSAVERAPALTVVQL